MMKALRLHGPGDLRLETVPKPAASAGSVVVRVEAAPIWDYVPEVVKGMRGYPLAYPLIFGTSCVGRIEELGAGVTALRPGRLVFCDYIVRLHDQPEDRIVLGYHGGFTSPELKLSSGHWKDGCFAEYACFPAENLHPIDENILQTRNLTAESLAEVASLMPAVGAANSIGIKAGETVLVLPSTGFFSSSVIEVVLALGANVVAGSRNEDELKRMIVSFGDDSKFIRPVVLTGDVQADGVALREAMPGQKGADAYIDYSPPAAASTTHIVAGLMALKRHGRCCFAGVILDNVALPYALIMANCLTIKGSFAQTRADVAEAIRLIELGRMRPRKAINGRFSLEEHEAALQKALENKGWENMVVLKP